MVTIERPATADAAKTIPSQAGWATYPALAYDGSGTLWAAWLERLDGADAIYLVPVGAAAGNADGAGTTGGAQPRQIVQAEAIKDGPALAWSATDGLCCAWQERVRTGP